MTSRSLICSSFLALSFVPGAAGATISGNVVLSGSHAAAGNSGKDLSSKDFSGVVISAMPVSGGASRSSAHITMLQKNKTFTPHVLPIETGTTVDFPNFDPIFHNAFSSYNGQIFDLGLYPPGTTRSVRFTRPGLVRVFCNIHPAMSAIILVLNTPYFTKTAKDGGYSMDVPPGEYNLKVFHERATEQELDMLSRQILVPQSLGPGDALRLSAITISEASYLVAPHKNKYGHDYPPSADSGPYPNLRN